MILGILCLGKKVIDSKWMLKVKKLKKKIGFWKIQISSWNIRTLTQASQLAQLSREMVNSYKVKIMDLSESKKDLP